MSDTIILGIGGFLHDGSLTIMQNGEIITAIELERINRKKHSGWKTPKDIMEVLGSLGIDIDTITHIAWGDEFLFYHSSKTRDLAKWFRDTFAQKIKLGIDHHLCHLASSFYASEFDEAVLVSIDGKGDMKSVAIGHGKGNKISLVSKVNSCYSLGRLWNATNTIVGMPGYQNSGKTMALSAFGSPKYLEFFLGFTNFFELGTFTFEDTVYEKSYNLGEILFNNKQLIIEYICNKTDLKIRNHGDDFSQNHFDFVRSLQTFTNMVMEHIVVGAMKMTGSKKVCLSGGVALNGISNMSLLKNISEIENIFIQPATGDTGLSLGAAYYMAYHVLGNTRKPSIFSPYLGRKFSDQEIESAIVDCGLRFSKKENICKTTARLLADNRIVGWFQGRDEIGPRSLGNRSILCNPKDVQMRDTINRSVKHREWFRPFAPSVLEEYSAEYFNINIKSPYMLLMPDINMEKLNEIPAVFHEDKTARIQTVSKEMNPMFYELIMDFHLITGTPVLLNTSFNDNNQAMVHSPKDAIECFLSTEINYLVIGDYLISKH